MAAIISTVEVLPLEPVTAMMCSGSCTRARMSGQIFRANLPGMELPLPTSLPTARPSLHTTMAKNFLMARTPLWRYVFNAGITEMNGVPGVSPVPARSSGRSDLPD